MADSYVKREGDWNKVKMILTGLGARLEKEVDSETKRQVMRASQAVKAGIEAQAFGHAPLNKDYREQKKNKGLDSRILIATGQYVRSITYWKEGKGSWVAGIRRGATHSGGVDMAQLGKWLEYGTKNMPARPHFRPIAREMRKGIKKGYSTAIRKAMRL